jgi:endogenous inhibitor of DNA gyrase (YacG/DUF329 family)
MHAAQGFQLCVSSGRAYLDAMAQAPYASKPCPICRKPAAERFFPFCSSRCKDVDLHRWMSGVYAIPAAESAEDQGEERDVSDKEGR